MKILALVGIGACSGIHGDPHSSIVTPSDLSLEQQSQLMKLELHLGKEVVDSGRYILAIVKNI